MNIFQVYKKSMLEQFRDMKALILVLLTPIVFIVIFGLAFGQGFYTYSVGVSNYDSGNMGNDFIQMLKESSYSNTNKVFEVSEVTPGTDIVKQLKNRKYALHLEIPENFTQKINRGNYNNDSNIVISGDPAYPFFSLAEVTIETYIQEFYEQKTNYVPPVGLKVEKINKTNLSSEFDSMAPGLMVMSVFFLSILSAMILTKESENKTLQRLTLSRLKTWELHVGVTLSQLTLVVIMIPLVIASAYVLGFKSEGSLWLTFLISFLTAFSSIGLGLIVAAFSRTSLQSFIIGNVVITPMFFLSGIFFPAPSIKLFTLMGYDVEVFTFLPSLHSVNAVNKVLKIRASFGDISVDLMFLTVLSLIIFAIGVALYNRKHMKVSQ